MRMHLLLVWAFIFSSTSGVSCRWWGRLIPPFLKRNQRSNRATSLKSSASGLRNLGNTCYMNSVLQSLFHSIPYRQKVLNSTFAADSVGEKLFWLFEEMEGSSCVDTAQVAYSLNLNVGSQEDAQEFLLRLLNEIDSSTESDSDNEIDNSEPVSTTFTGITEQIIKCTNVNFTKSRQQRFLDLTVDILGYDSLSSALKNMFSKPDYLTGENQYRVPKSADVNGTVLGLQDAEKSLNIVELPQMLCMTLKRFSFDVSTSSLRKIGDTLEFPLELDMKPYMKKIVKNLSLEDLNSEVQKGKGVKARDVYKLSSVVVHEGSATFGHYVCYARPDPLNTPESWIKLNDHSVSDVTFRDVCDTAYGSKNSGKSSTNAYLLFYVRVD